MLSVGRRSGHAWGGTCGGEWKHQTAGASAAGNGDQGLVGFGTVNADVQAYVEW